MGTSMEESPLFPDPMVNSVLVNVTPFVAARILCQLLQFHLPVKSLLWISDLRFWIYRWFRIVFGLTWLKPDLCWPRCTITVSFFKPVPGNISDRDFHDVIFIWLFQSKMSPNLTVLDWPDFDWTQRKWCMHWVSNKNDTSKFAS